MHTSEFADEYGDWLSGSPTLRRARWLDLTLGEIRYTPVLKAAPSLSIREVVALMNRHRESAVLVVEHEAILGIFTERDVLSRVVTRSDALDRPVGEVMTRNPNVLSESTLLSAALRTLALGSYHHLPVVDTLGRPVALVSLQTIIAFLADAFPTEIMNAPPERESYPEARDGA